MRWERILVRCRQRVCGPVLISKGLHVGFQPLKTNLKNCLDMPFLQISLLRPHQSSRIAARVDHNVVHPSNIEIILVEANQSEY